METVAGGMSFHPGRDKVEALVPVMQAERAQHELHGRGLLAPTQRVQVPNNQVLGFGVILTIVQVLGKYMIIRYLDPQGYSGGPYLL